MKKSILRKIKGVMKFRAKNHGFSQKDIFGSNQFYKKAKKIDIYKDF